MRMVSTSGRPWTATSRSASGVPIEVRDRGRLVALQVAGEARLGIGVARGAKLGFALLEVSVPVLGRHFDDRAEVGDGLLEAAELIVRLTATHPDLGVLGR